MTMRELKVEDALMYLDQVKMEFFDRPQIYNTFLDIMKTFKSQQIDTPGVIRRVSKLFQGNKKLILGFNTFLPEGYKIKLSMDTGREIAVYKVPGQSDYIRIAGTEMSGGQPAPPGPGQPQNAASSTQPQEQQQQQHLGMEHQKGSAPFTRPGGPGNAAAGGMLGNSKLPPAATVPLSQRSRITGSSPLGVPGHRRPTGSSGRSRKKTRTTKLAHQPATDHPKVEGVPVGNSLNINTREAGENTGYSREHNFSNQPQSSASPKMRRKKKSNKAEVIEFESSSEDEQSDAESDTGGENVNNDIMSSQKMECAEEYLSSYQSSQTENNFDNFGEESPQQATCRPRVLSLAQIILGKKFITHKCRVDIMLGPTPYLILEFEERQQDRHRATKLTIEFSDILEGLKYFILNDTSEGDDTLQSSDSEDLEDPSDIPLSSYPESFIVFDVKYDDTHDLNRFRKFYEPFPEQDQEDKRWIILEPRSTSRFLLLIDWLRSNKPINIQKLSVKDASKYIQKMNTVQYQHQTVMELEETLQKPENKDQVEENEDVCDNVAASNVTATTSTAHSEQEVNIDEIIKLFVFVEETHEAFDLSVQMCNTVGYVKHMIMEQKNIPVYKQCLLWKGDEMLDAHKLFEYYGIKNSSSLFLKKCISL